MSLHNGLDTVGIISFGVHSKTYGASDPDNNANLFSSLGYLEDAPNAVVVVVSALRAKWLTKFFLLKRRWL